MNICIIANNAYGALTGEESGHIGGVERQTSLLALWLVKKGHRVSVLTWYEGGPHIEYVDGIKIIKLCRVSDGFPILRFLTPRWTSLNKALKEANAELYYHNCAEYVTGQIAFWCKMNKRPFIYSVASDADCELELPNLKFKREEIFFRYGLKNNNLVIAQTVKQKKLLDDNYGLKAVVINMPGTTPVDTPSFDPRSLFLKQKVIWVGRLHKVKRIEWLIQIAKRLPNVNFEVIGPCDDKSTYMLGILAELNMLPNIIYIGKIARDQMHEVYQNASLLCNTSIYEGFPNTYLEAWSYGVPVIATMDPDEIIEKNNLGGQALTWEALAKKIEVVLSEQENWQVKSKNCLHYYQKNHQQDSVMKKIESTFFTQISRDITFHFDKKSEKWSDFYTQKARSISHLDLQHRLMLTKNILSSIKSASDNKRLLDLGCGSGDIFENVIQSTQWQGVGIDISPEMVALARKKYPQFNISVASATQLPFDDHSFSVIISLGMMEYIFAYQKAISEISRTLMTQGDLIISIPNKDSLFRRLRKFEMFIFHPVKKIKAMMMSQTTTANSICHQQWSLPFFTQQLNEQNIVVQHCQYCTYGFLSPKLADVKWNLRLSLWLKQKINGHQLFNRWLANTIVIHARAK